MAIKEFLDLEGLTRYDTNIKTYIDAHNNDSMSSTDKIKLDGIEAGAEVNQNAFSNVTVGSTTIAADSKTDTLTLAAGANVTLTPNATSDTITISATDTTYAKATQSTDGLMSAADKKKLDSIDGISGEVTLAADWAENDPTQASYIKNRTHYTEDLVLSSDDITTSVTPDVVYFWYKISNIALTKEQLENSSYSISHAYGGRSGSAPLTVNQFNDGIENYYVGNILAPDIIVCKTPATYQIGKYNGTGDLVSLVFENGIYIRLYPTISEYLNYFRCPNSVAKKLDDKYMPDTVPLMDGGLRQLTYNTNGESFNAQHRNFGTVTYRKVSDEVFSKQRLQGATYKGIYTYTASASSPTALLPATPTSSKQVYSQVGGLAYIVDRFNLYGYTDANVSSNYKRTMVCIVSVTVPGTYGITSDYWTAPVAIPAAGTYFLDTYLSTDMYGMRITSMSVDQDYLVSTSNLPDMHADWSEEDQKSVNYVKGRTHYATYNTLRFEGSNDYPNENFYIQATSTVHTTFYKVSDIILTEKQLKGSVVGYTFEEPDAREILPPHYVTYAENTKNAYFFFNDQMIGIAVVKVPGEYKIIYSGMAFTVTVPSAGTYFSSYGGGSYTTLSCRYASDVYALAEQYLPNTVPVMELSSYNYDTIIWSGTSGTIGTDAFLLGGSTANRFVHVTDQVFSATDLENCTLVYNGIKYETLPQLVSLCIGADGRWIVINGTTPVIGSFGAPGTYSFDAYTATVPKAGTYFLRYNNSSPYVSEFNYPSSGNYALKEENLPQKVKNLLAMVYAEEEEAGF